MNLRTYRTFEALVLAGLGIFFLARIGDGRILYYINQRFVVLTVFGALGFLFIAQVVMRARPPVESSESGPDDHHADHLHEADHEHSRNSGLTLWLVALPLLIGLLVPARPLGSAAAAVRGINTASPLTARTGVEAAGAVVALPSTQRSVLDWIRVFKYAGDPAEYNGQPADVVGFVYRDIRLGEGQFMVARFSLTCCVADAVAIGMLVDWPEEASIPENVWVRVRGPVSVSELDGQTVALIDAESVEEIPQPEQPYLFP